MAAQGHREADAPALQSVLIVETGDMVMFAVLATTPLITDLITIDGVDRVITNLAPAPEAGTVVLWKAWCAA